MSGSKVWEIASLIGPEIAHHKFDSRGNIRGIPPVLDRPSSDDKIDTYYAYWMADARALNYKVMDEAIKTVIAKRIGLEMWGRDRDVANRIQAILELASTTGLREAKTGALLDICKTEARSRVTEISGFIQKALIESNVPMSQDDKLELSELMTSLSKEYTNSLADLCIQKAGKIFFASAIYNGTTVEEYSNSIINGRNEELQKQIIVLSSFSPAPAISEV